MMIMIMIMIMMTMMMMMMMRRKYQEATSRKTWPMIKLETTETLCMQGCHLTQRIAAATLTLAPSSENYEIEVTMSDGILS